MFRSILAALALTIPASTGHAQADARGTASNPAMMARSSIASPDQPPSAPRASNAEAIAKAAIEARGYSDVKNLSRDPVGNWAAEAVRDSVEIAVILQPDGDVAEE